MSADDRVARYADHAFAEVEITCVGVGHDRPSELASYVNDDDLPAMRFAKAIGEIFGEPAPVTGGMVGDTLDPPAARPNTTRPVNKSTAQSPTAAAIVAAGIAKRLRAAVRP